MKVQHRHAAIVALLNEAQQLDVDELCARIDCSEATMRRDLIALEETGQLIRVTGGARLAAPQSLVERSFGHKRQLMRQEKECVARLAVDWIEPGMTVAIDSGTTAWRVAAHLRKRQPLTVITSAFAVIEELGGVNGITLHIIGGAFRPNNLDCAGATATAALAGYHADLALVTGDAFLAGRGLFAADADSAAMSAAIGACADRRIGLIDHSKIGGSGSFLSTKATDLDVLIVDDGLSNLARQALEQDPYELAIAESG